MKLTIGNKYKWKHENVILIFIGKFGEWNQFSRLDGVIWCEVLDSDLQLMELIK